MTAPVTWETVLPGLLNLFSAVSVKQVTAPGGVFDHQYPEWRAAWKDRKESSDFIHPHHHFQMLLKMTTCQAVGPVEKYYEMVDTGLAVGLPATGEQNLFELLGTYRKFTIQAQVWTTEETDDVLAMPILDRAATRLNGEWAQQRLIALNVDLTDTYAIRDLTRTIDGHQWSIASLDFLFTACLISVEPDPVGWIEKVVLTSHEQVSPGVDVSASLRMVNEQLPPD